MQLASQSNTQIQTSKFSIILLRQQRSQKTRFIYHQVGDHKSDWGHKVVVKRLYFTEEITQGTNQRTTQEGQGARQLETRV